MVNATRPAYRLVATLTVIGHLAPFVLTSALPVAAVAQIQVGDAAPSFTLTDQFGSRTTVEFPTSAFVVLVFANRSGRLMARNWSTALGESTNTPQLRSVACTGWVPTVFQSTVRKGFEQSKPILIDWNDLVAKRYGYSGTGFRLVAINPSGRVVAIEEGDCSPTRLAAIRRLLR